MDKKIMMESLLQSVKLKLMITKDEVMSSSLEEI